MDHKKITKEELEVFLRKHKLWLEDEPEGERADLSRADLSRANLYGADLSGANLSRADLSRANLYGADLSRADLSRANLYGANLSGADLSRANLYGADLYGADLSRANLYGADLSIANLYGADLSGANLSRANHINLPIACPEEGSFIGFKKCRGNYIVKLEILEDALRCSATGRKCRCSKAKVLSITNLDGSDADIATVYSKHDSYFAYAVGEVVSVDNFEPDRWKECSAGIHFFITRQEAVNY